jgi:periplasmic protein TonB
VLRRGVDPRTYGALLLEVGRRRSGSPLVMATFAEPRLFLEERIRRIATWPVEQRPVRALAFAVTAVVLFATGLSAGGPLRPVSLQPSESLIPLSGGLLDVLEMPVAGSRAAWPLASDTPPARPTFTPMTERPQLRNQERIAASLLAHYPPLLRAAGIGGTPVVWFYLDDTGAVQHTMLSRSSGYPALDEAALKVASEMEFTPALNRDRRVAVWVEIPIVFRTLESERRQQEQRATGERDALARQQAERAAAAERAALQRALAERAAARQAQQGGAGVELLPRLGNAEETAALLARNYPPLLRDAGIGGTAIIWYYLATDGRVLRTQIAQSSGYPALDQAALAVAARMQFSPYRKDGTPAETWVELPISFGGAAVPLMERRADLIQLPPLVVPVSPVRDGAPPPPAPPPPPPPNTVTRPAAPGAAPAAREELMRRPTFTPMTVRPELQNAREIQTLLIRAYPPELRDAGIGGTPLVWFFIDETGTVQRTQLSKSSGHAALDEAAQTVAQLMKFSPAVNRDTKTAVWVEIPIVFTAR